MSVDLGDLVDSLKRAVSSPGNENTTFPNATDDSWLGYLQDAFWEARMDGMLAGYVEADGVISPTSGSVDLTRDLQQLVVLYASIDVIFNQLRSLNTAFSAKAGPVEYSTQQSAQVFVGLLNDLKNRRDIVLTRLSDIGLVPSYYIDAVTERDMSIASGITTWVGY